MNDRVGDSWPLPSGGHITCIRPPEYNIGMPVVFYFGGAGSDILTKGGHDVLFDLLRQRCIVASFDLPYHEPNEPGVRALDAWVDEADSNVGPMAVVNRLALRFLESIALLQDKLGHFVDIGRIGLIGNSRGGFAAFHVACYPFQNMPRILCVGAFGPMVELRGMLEYDKYPTNNPQDSVYDRTRDRTHNHAYSNGASLFNHISRLPRNVNVYVWTSDNDRRVDSGKSYQLMIDILKSRVSSNSRFDLPLPCGSYSSRDCGSTEESRAEFFRSGILLNVFHAEDSITINGRDVKDGHYVTGEAFRHVGETVEHRLCFQE